MPSKNGGASSHGLDFGLNPHWPIGVVGVAETVHRACDFTRHANRQPLAKVDRGVEAIGFQRGEEKNETFYFEDAYTRLE